MYSLSGKSPFAVTWVTTDVSRRLAGPVSRKMNLSPGINSSGFSHQTVTEDSVLNMCSSDMDLSPKTKYL